MSRFKRRDSCGKFVIYRMYCKGNDKSYIGITDDFKRRFAVHWNDAKNKDTVLCRTIRKYGKQNFVIIQIDNAKTWEGACEKERKYIKKHNARVPNGMNMTDGGEGINGLIHSEETKMQMRFSHLGKGVGKDNPMYGKPSPRRGKTNSIEHRSRISESCMGRIPWNKGKKCPQLCGINNGFYGKKHSEETLEKMKESREGYVWSDETRKKTLKSREGCQIGERHSQARLTETNVVDIRNRYASKEATQYQLAEEFGVTQSNINCVIKRVSWRHI